MTEAKKLSELRDRLADAGVEYLFGAYVDIHGVPKAKCVPIAHLEGWAAGSELYTVGALEGMGDLGPNEDECVGIPDLAGLIQLPWEPRYAVAAADLYFHDEPYTHDCRRVLRRQVEEAASLGYRVDVGIETELYVLQQTDQGWRPLVTSDEDNAPTRGYDLESTILADSFLHPMVGYMNQLGWDVFSFDHEGGDGQYEFDFAYTDALTMADRHARGSGSSPSTSPGASAVSPASCPSPGRLPSAREPTSTSAWPTPTRAPTSLPSPGASGTR